MFRLHVVFDEYGIMVGYTRQRFDPVRLLLNVTFMSILASGAEWQVLSMKKKARTIRLKQEKNK